MTGTQTIPQTGAGTGSRNAAAFTGSRQHLAAELARLDDVLRRHVQIFRATAVPDPDPAAAFYIADAEVDALLAVPAGESPGPAGLPDPLRDQIDGQVAASVRNGVQLRLPRLREAFGLSPLDQEIVLICLAVETDRRYDRIYGYLQDDLTRRAPAAGLILDLTCSGLAGRLAGRSRFAPSAPLLRYALVSLDEEPGRRPASLLDTPVRLSPRIAWYLLGENAAAGGVDDRDLAGELAGEVDEALAPWVLARRPGPATAGTPAAERGGYLARLAEHAGAPAVIHCHGPAGSGQRTAAEAFCGLRGDQLLVVDTNWLTAEPVTRLPELLVLLEREVRLRTAVTYWRGIDVLLEGAKRTHRDLILAALARYPAPVLLSGRIEWNATSGGGVASLQVPFTLPDAVARRRTWQDALDQTVTAAESPPDLDALASSFRFSPGRIQEVAASAHTLAGIRDPGCPRIRHQDLLAACRAHSSRTLGELAQEVRARWTWNDLVLPADQVGQLQEIADQVRHRGLVHDGWGFAGQVAAARGINVLFAGPPGTGKTMAASVLAGSLGLDLYKIDLSMMVSKYIGETEKNLARLFDEAESSNAVLFFDEADALFGKRTQVRDAHDRYANLETSYLLQKLEAHDGVVILATNFRKNMDDAFVRRLHACLEFPVPGVRERLRIWQQIWPHHAPRDPGIDLELLAERIDLPGGHIRNIVLAGAFLAAADDGTISMAHLSRATQREYQKMGKILTDAEFNSLAGEQVTHD